MCMFVKENVSVSVSVRLRVRVCECVCVKNEQDEIRLFIWCVVLCCAVWYKDS